MGAAVAEPLKVTTPPSSPRTWPARVAAPRVAPAARAAVSAGTALEATGHHPDGLAVTGLRHRAKGRPAADGGGRGGATTGSYKV
ncbi:hypothetical protein ACU686_25560 [Yinghuangia aomiensis]